MLRRGEYAEVGRVLRMEVAGVGGRGWPPRRCEDVVDKDMWVMG